MTSKINNKKNNEITIEGITLSRTPAQMASEMAVQAMDILDVNFDNFASEIEHISAAEMVRVAQMMRRSAELLEAAAVLKTVTGMPTRCPNCGEDLTRYIESNEVW